MKTYILIIITCFASCNTFDKRGRDVQIELIVKEPLKGILDSLVLIDSDKEVIQELCVQIYDAYKYRVSLISRSYSLDKEYGKPICYFMSNNKKIDIYTGLENFFQPIRQNESKGSTGIKLFSKYRILEFEIGENPNKLYNLKIKEVPEYIPFLEIPYFD